MARVIREVSSGLRESEEQSRIKFPNDLTQRRKELFGRGSWSIVLTPNDFSLRLCVRFSDRIHACRRVADLGKCWETGKLSRVRS
jgi:hypothetical protein